MREPRQGKLRRLLGLKSFFAVNLCILFLVALSFGREFVRNYEIDKEIKSLEDKATALEARNQDILQLAERLKTTDYLEEEARVKLGLMKPGEAVAVIPEPSAETAVPPAEQTSANGEAPAKEKSNARLWLEYFLGT